MSFVNCPAKYKQLDRALADAASLKISDNKAPSALVFELRAKERDHMSKHDTTLSGRQHVYVLTSYLRTGGKQFAESLGN